MRLHPSLPGVTQTLFGFAVVCSIASVLATNTGADKTWRGQSSRRSSQTAASFPIKRPPGLGAPGFEPPGFGNFGKSEASRKSDSPDSDLWRKKSDINPVSSEGSSKVPSQRPHFDFSALSQEKGEAQSNPTTSGLSKTSPHAIARGDSLLDTATSMVPHQKDQESLQSSGKSADTPESSNVKSKPDQSPVSPSGPTGVVNDAKSAGSRVQSPELRSEEKKSPIESQTLQHQDQHRSHHHSQPPFRFANYRKPYRYAFPRHPNPGHIWNNALYRAGYHRDIEAQRPVADELQPFKNYVGARRNELRFKSPKSLQDHEVKAAALYAQGLTDHLSNPVNAYNSYHAHCRAQGISCPTMPGPQIGHPGLHPYDHFAISTAQQASQLMAHDYAYERRLADLRSLNKNPQPVDGYSASQAPATSPKPLLPILRASTHGSRISDHGSRHKEEKSPGSPLLSPAFSRASSHLETIFPEHTSPGNEEAQRTARDLVSDDKSSAPSTSAASNFVHQGDSSDTSTIFHTLHGASADAPTPKPQDALTSSTADSKAIDSKEGDSRKTAGPRRLSGKGALYEASGA